MVLDDKLNIADELEDQMETIVGTYQCEWKTTLESPEKLKRFSHFINSEKKDEAVQFVEVRDQIRPATKEERATKEGLIAIG